MCPCTERQLARSQSAVHAAMLSYVDVTVKTSARTDRRRKEDPNEAKSTGFRMLSPLLAGKALGNLDNLAPFWALLRSSGPRAPHNMELDEVVFRDQGFEAIGGSYPRLPKGLQFTVHVPIARNTSHISEGEVLCLPCFDP